MKTKTTLGVILTTITLGVALTGCGNSPTPAPTTPAPVVTETPTPSPTTTSIPEDKITADTVEKSPDGSFVLPDGTAMTCDDATVTTVVLVNGEWVCTEKAEW